eukprot:FR737474.1.p1 GENE.FR737474.1~~FR737474.1.p1  ORF type:complete len:225 (+),score=66.17 FR737474.1:615-1289(+)
MSELTPINCVALTARFPVGKPVVPAALMNQPPRGEKRFAYWGLFRFPRSLTRCARSFFWRRAVLPHSKAGITAIPRIKGINARKKHASQKANKKPGTPKKGRVGWGFFLKIPPPLHDTPQKTCPSTSKGGETPPKDNKKIPGGFPPRKNPPLGAFPPFPQPPPGINSKNPHPPPSFSPSGKEGRGAFFFPHEYPDSGGVMFFPIIGGVGYEGGVLSFPLPPPTE